MSIDATNHPRIADIHIVSLQNINIPLIIEQQKVENLL